jgi:hypothetical protein
MPSYRSKRANQQRPWLARRKRDEVEYFLGYHATEAEAAAAEQAFEDQERYDREQVQVRH